MLPQRSHITRKRGIYYYRRRLPKTFAGEIAISLNTRSFRKAEAATSILNEAFCEFFTNTSMETFDVTAALRSYLKQHLEGLRARHLATPFGLPIHVRGRDGTTRDIEADIPALDSQIAQFKSHLRRRDIRPVKPLIDQLGAGHELSSAKRVELGLGLLQVHIQVLEQSRKWLLEGLVEPIEVQERNSLSSTGGSPAKAVNTDSQKLSEVIPPFIELMTTNEGWRGQTLAQNQTTYRMFEECCGDRPVASYERRDLTKFYDQMRSLPKLYSKSKE